MSKEIIGTIPTLTFSHSLPFAHVLAYLHTVATIRRVARTDLEMAAHYAPDADMRTWLEKKAEEGLRRADGYLDIVRVMQPQPMAKELVANYLNSVMNPRRSGEDLKMVADIVAEQGLDRLEQMAKYGFQRSDYTLLLGGKMLRMNKDPDTRAGWLDGTEVVDYTDILYVGGYTKCTDETRIRNAKIAEALKGMMNASKVSFQIARPNCRCKTCGAELTCKQGTWVHRDCPSGTDGFLEWFDKCAVEQSDGRTTSAHPPGLMEAPSEGMEVEDRRGAETLYAEPSRGGEGGEKKAS